MKINLIFILAAGAIALACQKAETPDQGSAKTYSFTLKAGVDTKVAIAESYDGDTYSYKSSWTENESMLLCPWYKNLSDKWIYTDDAEGVYQGNGMFEFTYTFDDSDAKTGSNTRMFYFISPSSMFKQHGTYQNRRVAMILPEEQTPPSSSTPDPSSVMYSAPVKTSEPIEGKQELTLYPKTVVTKLTIKNLNLNPNETVKSVKITTANGCLAGEAAYDLANGRFAVYTSASKELTVNMDYVDTESGTFYVYFSSYPYHKFSEGNIGLTFTITTSSDRVFKKEATGKINIPASADDDIKKTNCTVGKVQRMTLNMSGVSAN